MHTAVPDEAEFHRWLSSGLGRAILCAKHNDVSRFHSVILDHCLHCHAFDPQMEGTHAAYIIELITLLPDREGYYDAILRALPEVTTGGWDRRHRFALARMMAEDGDERARRAMYDAYAPSASDGEGIGVEFVELDAISGLLFVAAKQGELLQAGAHLDLGWAYSLAVDKVGKTEVARALEGAAAVDPRVQAWRKACLAARESRERGHGETVRQLSYTELISRFADYRAPLLSRWGKHASAADLAEAAEGLENACSDAAIEAHLAMFSQRPFPGDINVVIVHARSSNSAIARRAAAVLKLVPAHPAVRELAFEVMRNSGAAHAFAIDMLFANFMPGDHEIALNWFVGEQDVNTRHSLGMGLRDLVEAYPEDEMDERIQSALYEWGPCAVCRWSAVKRLRDIGRLSAELRAECQFDSSDEVRTLVVSLDT